MKKRVISIISAVSILFSSFFPISNLAYAAEQPEPQFTFEEISDDYPVRDTSYSALWPSGNTITYTAEAGSQIFAKFQALNAGTATWNNTGSRFVSLYTVRPNYHESTFASNGPGWIDNTQIRMASDKVAPGEVGLFNVLLQVPQEAGTYTEHFGLAAEEYSWMQNRDVKIVLNVIGGKSEDSSQSGIYKDTSYQAQFLISSGNSISLKAGEEKSYQVGFKNIGTKTWTQTGSNFVSMYTIEPNYRNSTFATLSSGSGWLSRSQIKLNQAEVKPGQIGYFKFTIKAPNSRGSYIEKFRLASEDNTWIKGGEFELPINVSGGSNTSVPDTNTPSLPSSDIGALPTAKAASYLGPNMRVGLFNSNNHFAVSSDHDFNLMTGQGVTLATVPKNTEVQVDYNESTGLYEVAVVGLFNDIFNDYIILQATDDDTVMTVLSHQELVPWNPSRNRNKFRGSIEIRHAQAHNETWAINVLPMEHYLRGITETSSSSSVEFLKVMTVAARTFATYHLERQTKHASRNFYVGPDGGDQVYKGYDTEIHHPNLVQAVKETAGIVATYTYPDTGKSKIAITPYFSWSDGRTRAWSEVWGSDVPWAQSVAVPYDEDKPSCYGHCVGMSARGALYMVEEDSWTWYNTLYYFFDGIKLTSDWESLN